MGKLTKFLTTRVRTLGSARKRIKKELEVVECSYLQEDPTTACLLVAKYDDIEYRYLGVCGVLVGKDVFDAQQGRNIALGKAKDAIARQVVKRMIVDLNKKKREKGKEKAECKSGQKQV